MVDHLDADACSASAHRRRSAVLFQSWAAFGVQSQPAAALLAPDGSVLGGWFGAFPPDEVLSLVRNS